MKKILLTLIILTIALSISLSFIACKDTNDNIDDNKGKVSFSVTVNCDDVLILDTVSVKLVDTQSGAVSEEVYLTSSNNKATFLLAPSVYKVVLTGALSTYEEISETLVTPTSLNANISLTKKGSNVNVGNKVTYSITLTLPTGEPVANKTVQLCTSADEGGACVTAQTNESGVATFELVPNTYEIHIWESEYPEGYIFDDTEYIVTAQAREITVQFKAVSE